MTISAKIILGSISAFSNQKITTFELKYPRFIHSEFMTHRAFSKNAASSRAIPFKKMIQLIREDMAEPIHWGANQSGMQANVELSPFKKKLARRLWRFTGHTVLSLASLMNRVGIHKQVVNRMIEPWSHITVIMTGTEFENFFTLRDHPDAQPEIHELAYKMKWAMAAYEYKKLKNDEWHLPFIDTEDYSKYQLNDLIKTSIARCARVSYLTHDGKRSTIDKDLELYNKLIVSKPIHASPTEHQAFSLKEPSEKKYQGNFTGFIQFRKILEEKELGINSKWVARLFSYK